MTDDDSLSAHERFIRDMTQAVDDFTIASARQRVNHARKVGAEPDQRDLDVLRESEGTNDD